MNTLNLLHKIINNYEDGFDSGFLNYVHSYLYSYSKINDIDFVLLQSLLTFEKSFFVLDKIDVAVLKSNITLHKYDSSILNQLLNFYYLSLSYRLEGEYDLHQRFVVSDKFHFLYERPYLDICLKIILDKMFVEYSQKPHVLLTHDIDKLAYLDNFKLLVKTVLGDLFKRNSFYFSRFLHFITKKRSMHRNLSALINYQFPNIFLFLPNMGGMDSDYSPESIPLLVDDNGICNVGYHMSYKASNSESMARYEFELLNKNFQIAFFRSHYLRDTDISRNICSNHNLIDLTPYFIPKGGFSFGTSYPVKFSYFSSSRWILNTTFMDVTAKIQNNWSDQKSYEILSLYADDVLNYGGVFVLNWHNTSFGWGDWINSQFNYFGVCELLEDKFNDH